MNDHGETRPFDVFGPSPERDLAIANGIPEQEFGVLMFIASIDNPANPRCPGPIVVHADGRFECEGGCQGVRHAHHGPGKTYACDLRRGSTSYRCARCR